jgi:hypothetical protein
MRERREGELMPGSVRRKRGRANGFCGAAMLFDAGQPFARVSVEQRSHPRQQRLRERGVVVEGGELRELFHDVLRRVEQEAVVGLGEHRGVVERVAGTDETDDGGPIDRAF